MPCDLAAFHARRLNSTHSSSLPSPSPHLTLNLQADDVSLTSLYPPSPGPGRSTATDFLFLTILAPTTNPPTSSAIAAILPRTIPAISLGNSTVPPEISKSFDRPYAFDHTEEFFTMCCPSVEVSSSLPPSETMYVLGRLSATTASVCVVHPHALPRHATPGGRARRNAFLFSHLPAVLPHIRYRPNHAVIALRRRPQVGNVGAVLARVVF